MLKNQKLLPLLSLVKNDPEKTKAFTVGILGGKGLKKIWPLVNLVKYGQEKQKLSPLVTLAKNDQEKQKLSPLVSLAEKAKKTKTFTLANLGQK